MVKKHVEHVGSRQYSVVRAGRPQDATTAQLLPPMLRTLFWQLTVAAQTSSLPLAATIAGQLTTPGAAVYKGRLRAWDLARLALPPTAVSACL